MIIFGAILYFVIGYGMYRLTCVINPPTTEFCGGEKGEYTTWNGSTLPMVLGVCLIVWPLVLGVETMRFVKFTIHHLLQDQAKKSITKSVPVTPTVEPKDLFLEEGVREMEKCLTENME